MPRSRVLKRKDFFGRAGFGPPPGGLSLMEVRRPGAHRTPPPEPNPFELLSAIPARTALLPPPRPGSRCILARRRWRHSRTVSCCRQAEPPLS